MFANGVLILNKELFHDRLGGGVGGGGTDNNGGIDMRGPSAGALTGAGNPPKSGRCGCCGMMCEKLLVAGEAAVAGWEYDGVLDCWEF